MRYFQQCIQRPITTEATKVVARGSPIKLCDVFITNGRTVGFGRELSCIWVSV